MVKSIDDNAADVNLDKRNRLLINVCHTRLYDTTLTSIALSVFVTNLFKIQSQILFDLLWLRQLLRYQPADFEPETV